MRRYIPRLLTTACSAGRTRATLSKQVAPILSQRTFKTAPLLPQSDPIASSSKLPALFSPGSTSTSADPKPFYVTTPIFYVNASPHIGHLHSLILTDVLARFARLRWPERKVLFATGTDEHGLKIQQAARALGIEEEKFCTGVSHRFRVLAQVANVSNTDFIRTTEPRHYAAVEHFWNKLVASGDVYKDSHSGWYAVSDECFYSPSQIREKDGKKIAIETGNEVVWEEEENWKFRLSNYRKQLKRWIGDPQSVYPHNIRHDILRQISNLQDLSISRPQTRVQWGVPVPGDPSQTIYVWVDALINYLTVLGYPSSTEGWPADVHVVGKDIVRFHALHWPALLFAVGLEPPRRVLTHAHWTMNKSKMSKSKGNVANPMDAISKYGVDGVRWYLMREGGSLVSDSDYSDHQMTMRYKELSDQIGNLLHRMLSPIMKPRIGEFIPNLSKDQDGPLDAALKTLRETVESRMEGYAITKACEAIMDVIMLANQRFTSLQPWASLDATQAIVYAYQSLRITGILLQPFMPSKAEELLDRLGIDTDQRGWEQAVMPDAKEVDTDDMMKRLSRGEENAGGGLLFRKIRKTVAWPRQDRDNLD